MAPEERTSARPRSRRSTRTGTALPCHRTSTTTLIVPWMTKCSSAGAHIVDPPSSNRCASGNDSATARINAASAIGQGIVANKEQVHGNERQHRQARRSPERPPPSQAAEQIAAKQHFLGEAGLCEQAGHQRERAWTKRGRRTRGANEHERHQPESGAGRRRNRQSGVARPAKTDGQRRRFQRLTEQHAFDNQGGGDYQGPDNQAGLAEIAAQRQGGPLEQPEHRHQPEQQAQPLGRRVDPGAVRRERSCSLHTC